MSTDWGIGCRTCAREHRGEGRGIGGTHWENREKYFTGEFDNCRGTKALYDLIAARNEILALVDAGVGDLVSFHWNTADWGGIAHDLPHFFANHRGHDLEPMSEYLYFETEVDHEVRVELTEDEVSGWCPYAEARSLCQAAALDYPKYYKEIVQSLLRAHEVGRRRGRASRR